MLSELRPKYPGINKIGESDKKLAAMKQTYHIKKLTNIIKTLKDTLAYEQEVLEAELSKPEMLNSLQKLSKQEPENIEFSKSVAELAQVVKLNNEIPIDPFNGSLDDFDSAEELEKITNTKKLKRKASDESFYGSQSSFGGFRENVQASLEKPLKNSLEPHESSRLKYRRSCKEKKKEGSISASRKYSYDELDEISQPNGKFSILYI